MKALADTCGGHDHKIDIKIEDPSRGPGRVDFRAPDEGFGLEGTPKPKILRDPSPQKGNLICGPPLYRTTPENSGRGEVCVMRIVQRHRW